MPLSLSGTGTNAASLTSHIPGAWTSIATAVTQSGDATITFSSIPATYTDLHIRAMVRNTTTSDTTLSSMTVQLNGNSTAGNYHYNSFYFYGSANSSISSTSTAASTFSLINGMMPTATSYSNAFTTCLIDIPDYTSTAKHKVIHSSFGGQGLLTGGASGSYAIGMSEGSFLNTAAVTSISLAWTSATPTFGANCVVALYGIKAAS